MSSSELSIQQQIESHNARNLELLKTVESYGISLAQNRTCDLHFNVRDEAAARNLASALDGMGCQTKVREPFEFGFRKFGWGIEAKWKASPNEVCHPKCTEQLVRLADQHGSTYDGWGTALEEAARKSNE